MNTLNTKSVRLSSKIYDDLRPIMESHLHEGGAAERLGVKWLAVPPSAARTFTVELTDDELAELVGDLRYREAYHCGKYRSDDADRSIGLAARRALAQLVGEVTA